MGAFGQISMLRSGRGNDTEESNRQSERVGAPESVVNVNGARFGYQASISLCRPVDPSSENS